MIESVLFYFFSAMAVLGGILSVTRRHPMSSATALVVALLAVAGLYSLLAAPFVAVMQVLIYAGAIMVLILFVIMLLNFPAEQHQGERISLARAGLGAAIGVPLAIVFYQALDSFDRAPVGPADPSPESPGFGSVQAVGKLLFDQYLYPVEIVSLLLLVAIVGAILLSRRSPD